MSSIKICRLCVSACSNYRHLFDDLEVYRITVKYFDETFLKENDLSVVCYDCWCQIDDFYNFQQTVTESQKKLMDKPKIIKTRRTDSFQQNIHVKDEPQGDEMITDSPDSAFDDMLMPELLYGGENDDNEVPSELIPINNADSSYNDGNHYTDEPDDYNSKQQSFGKQWNGEKANKGQFQNAKSKTCPGPGPLKCRLCPKIMGSFTSYKNHFCQKHNGKEFFVYCCGQKYQMPQQYESHISLTSGKPYQPKSYQCKACQKRFDLEITLVRHTRQCPRYKQGIIIKKGVQKFKCSQCSESFASDMHLRKHVAKVHSDRRFHCTHCEKSYTKSDSLREHMAKHTGNYLYKCNDCSLDFTYRSQWRKHMLKFHSS
ncbi:uncharacterized protein isoform X2 [Musca autumnalis]|uniref:uncharacterized protein isoform X2 n=1 Tax=Musca autumnalis TaxID=221902 RepID=UPI003CE74EB9